MATLERGFTRVANEILEQVAKLKLNGTQFRILMIVWRFTYGFQRKEHDLSLTFIAKATEINKMQVQRELARLIDMKIIKVIQEASFNKTRVIAFNKNYNQWANSEQLAKKLTGNELDNSTGNELDNSTGNELDNQERKNLKKGLKKVDSEENLTLHKEIINYLNLKAGTKYRPNTKATQKHINARLNEGFTLDDFKTVIDAKVNDWLSDKKMSIYLRPETLFGTKFESYLNQSQINGSNSDEFITNGDGSFSLR